MEFIKEYYQGTVQIRVKISGYGYLTMFEIMPNGLKNLSGDMINKNIDLDTNSQLKIIGVDII